MEAIWEIVQQSGLQVGDQIPSIRSLSDRLKVKQSAVRDALLKAETMGLVKVLPRAGAFLQRRELPIANSFPQNGSLLMQVRDTLNQDEPNLFHLLDARRVIEIELVGRVAERRQLEDLVPMRNALTAMLNVPHSSPHSEYVGHDVRFHSEIAKLSGNSALCTIQRILMDLIRPHLVGVLFSAQRRKVTNASHSEIYEALVEGNAEKARAAMRSHLSLAYDSLLKNIEEVPNPGSNA